MIELRWVERPVPIGDYIATTERVLQYRTYHGTHFKDERRGENEGWTDWQDVPVEAE